MRLLLSSATGLIAAFLAAAPAQAEPKPSWVDPPAKSDGAKAEGTKSDPGKSETAKSEMAKSEMAKSETAKSETGKPEADGPGASDDLGRRIAEQRERRRRAAENRREQRAARIAARRDEGRRMAAPVQTVPSEIETDGTRGMAGPARGADPRFPEWAGRAQRLTGDYLDSVSNEAMVAEAPRFYGERVRFHGRTMSTAALIAEKRRFVRRWPERRYEPKDGTMRTACNAETASCIVRTVLGFRAENPRRGARSLGLSELTLTVSFAGERPVIVSETSRVLRRGAAAMSAVERPGNGA